MSRRDELDTELRKLALKVTKDAIAGDMDEKHDHRVETLKVAGNYFAAAKRVKRNDAPDEEDTMSAIQKRIASASKRTEGHA